MKTRTSLLPLAVILALVGCKKNEPAPGGSGTAGESPAGGAVAALGAAGALANFEGEIGLSAKSAKERKPIPPMTLTVKKTKFRFDVPEGIESGPRLGKQVHVILNAPEKKLFMVMDEQKMVMTMDLDKLGEQMKSFKAPGAPAAPSQPANVEPPKVTKTGHADTVAGYRCEDWDIVSAKGERAKVCVSSESASWFELPTIGLPTEHAWARELFDGHHLPLRLVGYDASGAEDGRLEITKIEKKPVADALFEIPAGYRTLDMGAMMKGLAGGMGGLLPGMMPPGMMRPHGDPADPGSAGSGLPPGVQLPPGMQLPPGLKLPPGVQMAPHMQMPANAAEMMKQMQERAKAAGIQPPPQ